MSKDARSEDSVHAAVRPFVKDSQRVQWWLAKLDRHDNVRELIDGAHDDAAGAHEAMYLHQRLGFTRDGAKYAVVRCEVFEPVPDKTGANEDALNTLNGIGLRPNTTMTCREPQANG